MTGTMETVGFCYEAVEGEQCVFCGKQATWVIYTDGVDAPRAVCADHEQDFDWSAINQNEEEEI